LESLKLIKHLSDFGNLAITKIYKLIRDVDTRISNMNMTYDFNNMIINKSVTGPIRKLLKDEMGEYNGTLDFYRLLETDSEYEYADLSILVR
jgi:hypothetical protein